MIKGAYYLQEQGAALGQELVRKKEFLSINVKELNSDSAM